MCERKRVEIFEFIYVGWKILAWDLRMICFGDFKLEDVNLQKERSLKEILRFFRIFCF